MLELEATKNALILWAKQKFPRLRALVIFGSYAKGIAGEASDLDLAALIAPDLSWAPNERFAEEIDCCADWTNELTNLLKFQKVSLVVLRLEDDGHPTVRRSILAKRIVLFDPDKLLPTLLSD